MPEGVCVPTESWWVVFLPHVDFMQSSRSPTSISNVAKISVRIPRFTAALVEYPDTLQSYLRLMSTVSFFHSVKSTGLSIQHVHHTQMLKPVALSLLIRMCFMIFCMWIICVMSFFISL